jgi:hypothetical protein
MNRANPQQVLERLIASPNDVTAAIAQCFKALVDSASNPPGSPILVTVTDYTKSPFSTRSRVFGRKALTDHVGMVRLPSLSLLYPLSIHDLGSSRG